MPNQPLPHVLTPDRVLQGHPSWWIPAFLAWSPLIHHLQPHLLGEVFQSSALCQHLQGSFLMGSGRMAKKSSKMMILNEEKPLPTALVIRLNNLQQESVGSPRPNFQLSEFLLCQQHLHFQLCPKAPSHWEHPWRPGQAFHPSDPFGKSFSPLIPVAGDVPTFLVSILSPLSYNIPVVCLPKNPMVSLISSRAAENAMPSSRNFPLCINFFPHNYIYISTNRLEVHYYSQMSANGFQHFPAANCAFISRL